MTKPINWQYFHGGHVVRRFWRYYKATINGKRVEKLETNHSTEYSIGNMDKAKITFKTEEELIKACYE